jgi:hypothetical protein
VQPHTAGVCVCECASFFVHSLGHPCVLVCVSLCALVFVVVFVFAEIPVSVKKKEEKGGRGEKKEETGGWGVFKKNTLKSVPNAFEMIEERKCMMIKREEKAKEDCKRKSWREKNKNDESKKNQQQTRKNQDQ